MCNGLKVKKLNGLKVKRLSTIHKPEPNQMSSPPHGLSEVITHLSEMGYYIFGKMITLREKKYNIALLHIVCRSFVLNMTVSLDIKRIINCNTLSFVHSNNPLPKGFTFIHYSPNASDDTLAEYRTLFPSPHMVFINKLEDVKSICPPLSINIECTTNRDLANLNLITDAEMEKINKIYVPLSVFDDYRDNIIGMINKPTYNADFLATRLVHLDELREMGKLLTEKPPSNDDDSFLPFTSSDAFTYLQKKITVYDLDEEDKIPFQFIYNSNAFEKVISPVLSPSKKADTP